MVGSRLAPALAKGRQELVRLATADPRLRRWMARAGNELVRAARIGEVVAEARAVEAATGGDELYGGRYFGLGRDPSGDRHGQSGYATYDRVSSNADIAAYLLWRNFRARRTLDVGCARGYLVEALRDLGVDAHGCDVSRYAVEHAAPGALGYVRLGDLSRGLPYADGQFDLVTALEILEHLTPDAVPAALAELRRVCGGLLYATIPSFGRNPSGPHGHLDGKVRPERLAYYDSLGDHFTGPVPFDDLAVDADGRPIEGHLTIASFDWWTARFADAGFDRWADVESRLYADIAPAGLGRFWNLYVFALPDTPLDLATPHRPDATLRDLGLVHPLIEHAAMEAAAAEDG
ncbi:MAG TPA: class I SAM-dependent methyltransferase [Acidimicrobiales bacterium]|nr:class I SAM-dependent methyltransferase [Acidimicrobiales bacterium]